MVTTSEPYFSDRAEPHWRTHVTQFGLLFAVLCAVQIGALSSLIEIWYHTTTYNHGFLVLPASAYLIWRRRAELAEAMPENALSALVPLAGFSAIGLIGELSGVNAARHIGFVGALMSIVPLCFGWRLVRRFWFPVLFLLFMVPVGDFLIAPLQELTADVSVWLIQLSGVPVYREGLMIELPSGLWEVAEACAGVRFLIANLFVAAVFAYLSYDRAWKWVLFAVLAIAIPVGANCLRAYGIMMLAHVSDNALAVGVDHLVYGWVFFSLVMLAMLWVGGWFADRPLTDPDMPADERPANPSRGGLGIAVAGALLIGGGPALAEISKPIPTALPSAMIAQISPDGWARTALPDTPDRWTPRFAAADALEIARFTKGGQTVDMMLAYFTHQRDGAEALHYANRFDDDDVWLRAEHRTATLQTGNTGLPETARFDGLTHYQQTDTAEGTIFTSRAVASWVWVGGTLTASPLRAKLVGMQVRLSGGEAGAAVIALSAQHDTPEDRAEAMAAIESLLADLPPLAPALDAMGTP